MPDILVLLFVTFYTNDFKLPYKYLSLLYVFGTKRTPKGAWMPCGWWVLNGPDQGRDPFIQNSNRSNREKWSTSKGGPVFSKLPFPVGPNRSIEFWTEISGNFGWMDRAPHQCSLWTGSVFPSPHPARLKACPQANINIPAQLYKNSGQAKALINQLNRLEQEKYLKLFQLLCLEVAKIN